MSRGGPWPHVGLAAVAVAAAAVLADPAPTVEEAFRFADREIDESSGLARTDGLVLTINDSGDDPVVYVVDPASGETVGRTTYTSDEVEDVEAIGVAPDGTAWVADIGDNGADRDTVALYAVPGGRGVWEGDRYVDAPRYDLAYPGGPRDAETLLVDPRDGGLLVVTKSMFGGAVFAAPPSLAEDTVNRLRPVGTVDGFLTDGTMTADGSHALLRGYGRLWLVDTEKWRTRASMPLPDQRQGEGIMLGDDAEHVVVSSEGARTEVLVVPLADTVLEELGEGGEGERDGTGTPGAEPGRDEQPLATGGRSTLEVVGLAAGGVLGVLVLGVVALGVRGARRRSRSTR